MTDDVAQVGAAGRVVIRRAVLDVRGRPRPVVVAADGGVDVLVRIRRVPLVHARRQAELEAVIGVEPEQHHVPLAAPSGPGGHLPEHRPCGADEHDGADADHRQLEADVLPDAAREKGERRQHERQNVGEQIGAETIADAEDQAVGRGEREQLPRARPPDHQPRENQHVRQHERGFRIVPQVGKVGEVERGDGERHGAERGDRAADAAAEDAVGQRDHAAEQQTVGRRQSAPRNAEYAPGDRHEQHQIEHRPLEDAVGADLLIGGNRRA